MNNIHKAIGAAILAVGVSLVPGAALAKPSVNIAFIGPLTGGNAAPGLGARNSTMLAVEQRNADPKAKYHYNLVTLDDQCKPNIGIQEATKVGADRSVIVALPHYCSAVGIATVDVYHRFHLPTVFWGAILPAITYGNNYKEIHRVSGTMINEADIAAEFLTKNGYNRVAIILDTTDYGKSYAKYFEKALTGDGGKIVAQFAVSPDAQDVTAELTKIKAATPDVVFVAGLTPLGVRVRTQMDRVGLKVQMAGASGLMTAGYIDGAAASAKGTLSFHNGAPIDSYKGGSVFLNAYKAAGFHEDPDAYGPFAYAAANLAMDAIEEAGPNRRKVNDILDKTANHPSLVGNITFDAHGQNLVKAHVYVEEDGKWVYWPRSAYAAGKLHLLKP